MLLSSWTPPGCEPSRKLGPHAPNLVAHGSTLGVVFADQWSGDDVYFGKLGLGGWEVPETWVAHDAFETEPPLVSTDGTDIAASSPPALAWSESSSNEKKRGRILGAVMTAPGTVGAPFWVHKRRDARFVVNASGQGDHFAFAWSRDDRRKNGTVHWSMYRLRPDEVGTSRPEVLFSAP